MIKWIKTFLLLWLVILAGTAGLLTLGMLWAFKLGGLAALIWMKDHATALSLLALCSSAGIANELAMRRTA